MDDTHMIPADLEAERAILASCLIDPAAMALTSALDPGDMYDLRHRAAFGLCLDLYRSGQTVEAVSVYSRARVAGCADVVEMRWLLDMMGQPGSSLSLPYYLDSVRRYARLRAAAKLATTGLRHLGAGELDDAENSLSKCAAAVADTDARFPVQRIDGALSDLAEHLDAAAKRRTPNLGMPTGIKQIDRNDFLARGLHKGDLSVLAARPTMGKSALALRMAYHVAQSGEPVLYSCSEMPRRQMAERIISDVADVDYGRIRAGTISAAERAAVNEAAAELSAIPLYLYDRGSVTVPHLIAKCREVGVAAARPVGLLVVDHINRMGCEIQHKGESAEYARVSHNYQALQAAATNERMHVLALAQLNRSLEQRPDKRPRMSDLRASGRAEEEAAVIMMLYRHAVYYPDADPTAAELAYVKHRGGKLGTMPLRWVGNRQRFTDAPQGDGYHG